MSFCHVFGFFHIDFVSHLEFATLEPLRKTSSSENVRPVALFPIYKSGISNAAGAITGTNLRAPWPFRTQVVERGAIVIVVGVLYVRPAGENCLIEASGMEVFPADPSHPDIATRRIFSPFPASYITASGVITGPHYRLSDRKTVVPIRVSQTVRESFKTFEITCVISIPLDHLLLNPTSTDACYHPINCCWKNMHTLEQAPQCSSTGRARTYSHRVCWQSMPKISTSTFL